MTLIERLEATSSQFEAIFADGKLNFFEINDTIKLLGTCVAETIKDLPGTPTEEKIHSMLMEAWNWADGKYSLVQKADDAIKLNALLEAFDGMLIRNLIERVGIPQLAKKLAA